jgi:hypothetical protein
MVEHRHKKAKKYINKYCKGLDERRFMPTYGRVWQLTTRKLILIFDTVIPAFWILAIILPEKYNKEWARINRREKNGRS